MYISYVSQFLFFFQLQFTLYKTEQPVQGMELQEKDQ